MATVDNRQVLNNKSVQKKSCAQLFNLWFFEYSKFNLRFFCNNQIQSFLKLKGWSLLANWNFVEPVVQKCFPLSSQTSRIRITQTVYWAAPRFQQGF